MANTQAPARNEPTEDDSSSYLDRVTEETDAIKVLHGCEVKLSNDLTALATDLHQLRQEAATEEREKKIDTCLQKIQGRLTKFDEQIRKHELVELRGPWSLNVDVQNEVEKQNVALRTLIQRIQSHENRISSFFADGDENRSLSQARGVSARWLQEAHDATVRVVASLDDSFQKIRGDFVKTVEGEAEILTDIAAELQRNTDLLEEGKKEAKQIEELSKRIKASADKVSDKMNSPEMDKFLKKVGDRVDETAKLDSIEASLGAQKEILNVIKDKQNEHEVLKQSIAGLTSDIKKLTSRPVLDNGLLMSTYGKVEEIVRLGKVPHPKIDDIHKGMMAIMEKQDIHEDNRERIKQLSVDLEKVRTQEKPEFGEIKSSLRYIEGQLRDLRDQSPEEFSKKLEEFVALLDKAHTGIEGNQKALVEIGAYFQELKSRPQIDPERLREMEKMLHEIQNRQPDDFEQTFKGFSQKLKELSQETQQGFHTVNSSLDEAKGELNDINVNLGQTNKHLGTINQSVDAIDANLESATTDLKTVKTNTEGLKLDVQGVRGLLKDHSGNIETEFSKIHQNLNEVKSRPALNTEFTDIHGQMGLITEAIGKYESTSILGHLENLGKDLHANPMLNMNPEDVENGFKRVTKLIEARPPVDQQPILDGLDSIKRQTEMANDNLANLQGVAQDVHFLRNRPLIGPHELRDVVNPLHAKLDTLRTPILSIEGTALTQDYFDQRHPAAATKEDRDRTKAILDTVQDVQNQVVQIGERPGFNPQPVNSLHRDVTRLQEDHKNNIEALAAKVDSVPQTVGAQMAGMRSEVKQDINQLAAQLAQINEKQAESNDGMKFVRNVSLGAAILSGVTLAGVLGYMTFFGKKKQNEANAKRTLAARDKRRLHARSWTRE
jgi:uncharacterized phage infection (PIP) family protein YhgE